MSREPYDELTRGIGDLEDRLATLNREASAIRGDLTALRRQVAQLAMTEAAPLPTTAPTATPAATAPASAAPSPATFATTSAPAANAADAVGLFGPRHAAAATPTAEPTPTTAPPPAAPRPAADAAPSASPTDRGEAIEEQVALVWFARIGALVLLCGVGYLYSYAVDRNWIAPLGRCLLGAAVGAGLLATATALRRTTNPLFIQVLLGLGLAFLYLSDYAAYSFYSLVTVPTALQLAASISVLGGFLAMRYRSEAVFVFSLLGGFLAPVLLSTGQDQPIAFFGYLIVLSSSSLVVSLRQRFGYAMWIAIAGVQLLFFGWYAKFFDASGGAYLEPTARWPALVAVAAFLAISLRAYQRARDVFEDATPLVLLVIALIGAQVGYSALLFDVPSALLLAFLVLGAVAIVTLTHAQRGDLLALPLLTGWAALIVNNDPHQRGGLMLPLALAFAWAALYFAAVARELSTTPVGTPPSLARLVTASLAGLGAALYLMQNSAHDDDLLHAAALAAIAVADGALAFTLRRRDAGRRVNLLVAQALTFVAIAAAFALPEGSLTFGWVLLSTAVLALAAHESEGDWRSFGIILWLVTVARCLFRLALQSEAPLVELELAACAVGLLASWALVRQNRAPSFQRRAPWLLTAGHILLLWTILRRLSQSLPALPDTLILAVYATLLIAGGFLFRERHHRYLGLTLFAVTILKLVTWDVFHQDVLFRVLVLIGVGILLLGASFLYARYGRRLLALVRDGELDSGGET